jgi:hypothetical protein
MGRKALKRLGVATKTRCLKLRDGQRWLLSTACPHRHFDKSPFAVKEIGYLSKIHNSLYTFHLRVLFVCPRLLLKAGYHMTYSS